MAVHDFIRPDEIEAAPEDPAMAFAELVGIADKRLAELCEPYMGDQESYAYIQDYRHGFENVVIGLARSFNIEPFATRELARRREYDFDDYRDFRSDLDHYMTQLLVDNTLRNKRYSVPLSDKDKNRIRAYLHRLREAMDNADLTDAKRAALHKKLADFEVALDKPRLNLTAATVLTVAVLGLPGSIWQSAEVVGKLTQNVLTIIAEAKQADDEDRRLAPTEPRAALIPPRQEIEPPKKRRGRSFDKELDDEIPF
jgi:hypothetical protein